MYEAGHMITGCPASVLEGIAFAESTNGKFLNHPDPADRGWFGLHETPAIHAERAKKWGEYDASVPAEAARITGLLYRENLAYFNGDIDKAIAAHKQGKRGVKVYGINYSYLNKVKSLVKEEEL